MRPHPAAPAPLPAADPGRIATLDGLRGVAILLVMGYHFSFAGYFTASPVDRAYAWASSLGWIGVDLFFVLSGFLITRVLLDTRERAGYFRNFYARRSLRIFPLYYAFWLLVLLARPLLAATAPAEQKAFWDARFWYLGYGVNFLLALRGEWSAAPLGTAHLWSLAVEEQFYLAWPLLVFRLPARRLAGLCAALAGASLLLRVGMAAAGASPVAIYVLPFTRMDALLVGAGIAAALRVPGGAAALDRLARLLLPAAGAVALALLAAAPGRMKIDSPWVHTVGFTAIALFFGALLVRVVHADPRSRLARVMGREDLRRFGTYGYALYLFHPLVMEVLVRHGWGPSRLGLEPGFPQLPAHLAFTALATLVSLAVAWASWNLIEEPFLRLKDRFAPPPPAPPAPRPGAPGDLPLPASAPEPAR